MELYNEELCDVLWVARDAQGHVALCLSLGCEIPRFVKSDVSKTASFRLKGDLFIQFFKA